MTFPSRFPLRRPTLPLWSELRSEAPRIGAVLVTLFLFGESDFRVLLLRRSQDLNHHAGEMCFPGGEREGEDKSPWETAVREAHEEMLLDPRRVVPVCSLPKVHAFVSGFDIFPVLGVVDCTEESVELQPNEDEIVSFCLEDITRLERVPYLRTFEYLGWIAQSPEYVLEDGSVVWGVTGTILSNVLFEFRREGWFR